MLATVRTLTRFASTKFSRPVSITESRGPERAPVLQPGPALDPTADPWLPGFLRSLSTARPVADTAIEQFNLELDELFGAALTSPTPLRDTPPSPPSSPSCWPQSTPASSGSGPPGVSPWPWPSPPPEPPRPPPHGPSSPQLHPVVRDAGAGCKRAGSDAWSQLFRSQTAGGASHSSDKHSCGCSTHGPGRDDIGRSGLTHLDAEGQASMVDVGEKRPTARVAVASARVVLGKAAFEAVASESVKKGDVLAVARVAGICGAKKTADLIPLCHGLLLNKVSVDFHLNEADCSVGVRSEARTMGPTGVEMEALTAASVAALTIYDMCKAVSKGIRITDVQLESKSGGNSGDWIRQGG